MRSMDVRRTILVSTHSRSKAAADIMRAIRPATGFQLTAARRRLPPVLRVTVLFFLVSTHSRSKAAAATTLRINDIEQVSTHSRSKAAALFRLRILDFRGVSTHSRSKAAAFRPCPLGSVRQCFNSQPLEGGCAFCTFWIRLSTLVSTHSRSKAAA